MKSPFIHLIFALAACAALLAGYGVWYAVVSEKSALVAVLQSQIDAKTATVDTMATARAAFAEMAGDETVVQSYFVPETGVVSFIDSLEGRGRALGATVSVLSVSASQTAPPTLTLALSVTGTFDAVLRTVGAIEYAPYDIVISSLSVAQGAEDTWHADLKLSVGSVKTSGTNSTKSTP